MLSSFGTYLSLSILTKEINQPTTLTITTQPSRMPTQKLDTSLNYPKRQFDATMMFFQNYPYPQSLLSISEDNLIGMKCSPQYLKQVGEEYTLGTNPEIKLTDRAELQLITKMQSALSKDITTFMSCVTNDNRTIIAYEVWGGGGGSQNIAYFSTVSSGVVGKATSIPNDGSPYWTCQQPLQLTTSDKLYFKCGGADGGYGVTSIYEIDLNTNSSTRIYTCTSQMQNESETPTITCE